MFINFYFLSLFSFVPGIGYFKVKFNAPGSEPITNYFENIVVIQS